MYKAEKRLRHIKYYILQYPFIAVGYSSMLTQLEFSLQHKALSSTVFQITDFLHSPAF